MFCIDQRHLKAYLELVNDGWTMDGWTMDGWTTDGQQTLQDVEPSQTLYQMANYPNIFFKHQGVLVDLFSCYPLTNDPLNWSLIGCDSVVS